MTAALLDRAEPVSRPRPAPRLLPVPDAEPPLVRIPDSDDGLEAARMFAPAPRPRTVTPAAPRRRPIHLAAVVKAPPMAHRRWAPAGTLELVAQARGSDGHQKPAAPPRVHSAVGTVAFLADGSSSSSPWEPARPIDTVATAQKRPSATDTATVLARATLEALAGARPIAQLRTHFTAGVYEGLQEFPMLGGRQHVQLTSLWTCQPTPDTAEISVAFRAGTHTRAMSMQMRSVAGHWYVTALQLG